MVDISSKLQGETSQADALVEELKIQRGSISSQAEQTVSFFKRQVEDAINARKALLIKLNNANTQRLRFLEEYKLQLQLHDSDIKTLENSLKSNEVNIREFNAKILEQNNKIALAAE